jgi:hypothetical protein
VSSFPRSLLGVIALGSTIWKEVGRPPVSLQAVPNYA